jgi:hypothetical protein
MARVAYLHKQCCFFKKRKIEIARHGLCFLNDLDVIEVKEVKREGAQDHEVFALVFNILDLFNVLGLDDFNLDLAF